jgi:Zn-dependent peptidase ImmA (M78 family)
LTPLAPLDPFKLAEKMLATVVSPSDIPGLNSNCLHQLLMVDSDAWSAGSIRISQQGVMIILNPIHPDTRKRATLMEELSHIYLGHAPSKLTVVDGGLAFRSFKKTQETEAYWVGAAALVPRVALERARRNGSKRGLVANYFGVSVRLVSFRENVTGIRLPA